MPRPPEQATPSPSPRKAVVRVLASRRARPGRSERSRPTPSWILIGLACLTTSLTAMADTTRIGVDQRIATVALRIAADRGYFERESISIELVDIERSVDIVDQLAEEEIDLGTLTADGLLRAAESGLDLRGTYVLGISSEADAIVARRELLDTRRLRGERVAFAPDSASELLLQNALQLKGRRLTDVVSVPMPPAAAAVALRDGKVNAAVLQQPELSGFTGDPAFHVLATAARPDGLVSDLLVGTDERLDGIKEATKSIIRAIARANAWMRRHPDETIAWVAAHYAIDAARARDSLDGVRLLDVDDNMTVLRGEFQKSFSSMSEVLATGRDAERAREVPSANRYLALSALRQVAAGR